MTVYLVGAGPGDPGLLTVRAARLLSRAGVVIHDRLAGTALLSLAPEEARRIDVGKRPGKPVPQREINELLVEHGRSGACVVRLKGGDPFVFGRGGEEAMALQEAGVDYEVVPGVSAALAAPAYAGVPVTHRGMAASFAVVTGHSAAGPGVEWERLARSVDTLVVLMGVAHRGEIALRLVAGGRPAETPVLAVSWATHPHQRAVRTTLAELGAAPVDAPATLVIGDVAAISFDWLARRPLLGQRVVVTRAEHQAPAVIERLWELGAEPVALPVIETAPPDDGGAALASAAARLGEFDWVILTSANAASCLLACVPDARAFGRARVAALGPGTAAALASARIVADLVPDRYVAEGLLEAFPPAPAGGGRVLLPRAAVARDVLPRGLEAAGWRVEVVEAYRTVRPAADAEAARSARSADWVMLTASSTVTGFVEIVGDTFPGRAAAIGPVTAAAAAARGLAVAVEATEHTTEGLVRALVERVATEHAGPPAAGGAWPRARSLGP
ncbi:MAG: uroporphyrinogen-III C-methyltransferase [Acidimicrobiales bacterium]